MADTWEGLIKLLDSLGESAEFAAYGHLTPMLPGLEVDGVGEIGMPVSAADAKRLIAQAAQAPYGRGEETIVDTGVRRVWQLEPSQFKLRNAAWEAHVAEMVAAVKQAFGINGAVTAELYKLLVYEKGSFFAPHRDTEKTPGMFATLVVALPSRHQGGRLIVRHDGQTKDIDFAAAEAEFKTQYAAFYADCQHEIERVTAGYRVCLVYNLSLAKKKKQPSAPQSGQAVEKASQLLRELFSDASNELDKLAVPFTHKYTEAGIDPRELKGADRARADVLTRAAESLGYRCYIALLTHWQSGSVDYNTWYSDDDWGSRRYGSHRSPDSEAEMEEVYDESLSLDHWFDPHGEKQPFREIRLETEEVLGGTEGWSYEQEVSEATGNEGATLERWYRRAAAVIWPPDRTFTILARQGQATALPELERMAAQSKTPGELESCRLFAEQIIARWRPTRDRYDRDNERYPARMLAVLERVGTEEVARRFLRDVLPRDFDGSEGEALARLCERFGWQEFAAELCVLVTRQKPSDSYTEIPAGLAQSVSLCRPLFCTPPSLAPARRKVCEALADELVRAIELWDGNRKSWHASETKRRGVVDAIVRCFAAIESRQRLDWFAAYVLEDAKRYDLRQVLGPDVKAIFQWLADVPAAQPAARRLREECLSRLQALTAQAPQPPRDWRREAKLECKCADCRALTLFLQDPAAQVGRFPLRKERRQHLHQQIDRQRLDCTHETQRTGSPQTLVCTKTQASFERDLKQYQEDLAMLAELEALADVAAPAAKRRPSRKTVKK